MGNALATASDGVLLRSKLREQPDSFHLHGGPPGQGLGQLALALSPELDDCGGVGNVLVTASDLLHSKLRPRHSKLRKLPDSFILYGGELAVEGGTLAVEGGALGHELADCGGVGLWAVGNVLATASLGELLRSKLRSKLREPDCALLLRGGPPVLDGRELAFEGGEIAFEGGALVVEGSGLEGECAALGPKLADCDGVGLRAVGNAGVLATASDGDLLTRPETVIPMALLLPFPYNILRYRYCTYVNVIGYGREAGNVWEGIHPFMVRSG